MSDTDGSARPPAEADRPAPWRNRAPQILGWLSLLGALSLAAAHWSDEIGGDAWDYIRSIHDLTGSRFPPGFPLLLLPLSGSLTAMRLLGTATTLALVALIWCCALRIAGWWAAAAAGVLIALSPLVTGQASLVMSDALAAALTAGALLALLHGRDRLAAVLIALSAWFRIMQAAFVLALPRKVWITCALILAPLLLYNIVVNGSLTGYAPGDTHYFQLANLTGPVWYDAFQVPSDVANWQLYPLILLGVRGGLVPGLLVLGAIGLWRHWSSTSAFAVKVVVINVALYLFYYWQSPRFVLPAASMLLVYAATAVVPRRGRPEST